MSVENSGDPIVTVHSPGDIVPVACAGGCGRLVWLTWTSSAVNRGIYHGDCWNRRVMA